MNQMSITPVNQLLMYTPNSMGILCRGVQSEGGAVDGGSIM